MLSPFFILQCSKTD